ncbi:MAG: SDR family NAD(P)-dependent oxidoreductase [Spirosomataceae bacterium]
MKEYILITGASSGIGLEMTRLLAEKNHNLILIARNAEKLQSIQSELMKIHPVDIDFFPFDLAEPGAAVEIHRAMKEKGYQITGLINNAGFGEYGPFWMMPLATLEQMVAINITALMGLTRLFGEDMVQKQKGRILHVASLLSFLPFPYYSVYSSTKAFVLDFSETIAAEMESKGVVVTTLCPGTVETPFHTDSMRKTHAMRANRPMSAHAVAQAGVRLFLSGHGKKVVGTQNWFLSNLPRLTPDRWMMRVKIHLASLVTS